jgi:hypothetical protein
MIVFNMEASFIYKDDFVLLEVWSKACQSVKLEMGVNAGTCRLFSSRELLFNEAIHINYRS